MYNFNTLFGTNDAPSQSLPSSIVAPEFGEVSIRQVENRLQVAATLAMGAFLLGDGEQCMVGLALDASQSMQDDYGRGKTIPSEVSRRFVEQGMFTERVRDGVTRRILTTEAKKQAISNGWAVQTKNIVQKPCSQMIDNLIRTFATGGVTSGSCEVIYWACDADGKGIESLGTVQHNDLKNLMVDGPRVKSFGAKTQLAPPLLHFAEKALQTNGVLVFVTDGHIEDEAMIVAETHRIAKEIQSGQRPSLKCVLLGFGKQVDRAQLTRIDDMEMPPGLEEIDIWNAKVLGEMRDMNDAWSEIFDPDTVVGTSIRVFNDQAELVHEKTDEVKALITFEMPVGSSMFELVLDGEMKIKQPLVLPSG
ncbi:MAG: hypothetical protein COA78_17925 [Blastopirellula sp.]|nr:MAG: hypothetical protein COA78_17925 [Blastopirellula sp.]